ncbi:hypothetical protein UO65_1095 [Actinokineospora spheciospongiae]|uniref:DUF5667 domain-containing protein n=1 Tax=Actinokineospora spheciospongiae TaxID=909613 RepID=W7IST1_9PSEU|nr:DUF5667 domain-containing protein [Actinokineospora spheciospongiae]EWC63418.1 hypothetical protein UO65_1095 [Actinokineospora spheciospongiae]
MESGSGSSGPRDGRAPDGRAESSRADLGALLADLDDDFTDDDRAVLGLFAQLGPLTGPDPAARDRIFNRVLTEFPADRPRPTPNPRPVRAGRAPRSRRATATTGSTRPGEGPRTTHGVRGRFAVAAVAVLVMVFSLGGMSLLLARDALPGDPLYGIKRTGEAASLGLTFGDEERAFKHLEFASARITEIETLTQRHPDPADGPVSDYLAAFSDFEGDTTAGTRQLLTLALVTTGDGGGLDALGGWAAQQGSRLAAVRDRLPAAAANRESTTSTLLTEVQARSAALLDRLPCHEITSGAVDELGPLPATTVCALRPGAVPPPPSQAGTQPGAGAPGTTTGTGQVAPTTGSDGPAGLPPAPGAGSDPVATTTAPTPVQPPPSTPGEATTTTPPRPGTSTPPTLKVPLPLPLPTIAVPPILGLPGIEIG